MHCANCHRLLSFSFSLRCVCVFVCVCTRFSQCPFNFTVSWLLKRQLARKGKQRRQGKGEGESWRCLPQAVCKILINSIIKRIYTQQHAHTPAYTHTLRHTRAGTQYRKQVDKKLSAHCSKFLQVSHLLLLRHEQLLLLMLSLCSTSFCCSTPSLPAPPHFHCRCDPH